MATEKAKRAAKIKLENPELPMRHVMRMAGYSQETADTPRNLTESKGWQELMDKYLPDEDTAKVFKHFLKKKEVVVVSDGSQVGSHFEFTGQLHSDALKAAQDVQKMKGRYKETPNTNTLILNVSESVLKKHAPDGITRHDSE